MVNENKLDKVCSMCKRSLPLRAFSKVIGYKNDLYCWCKLCVRRYNADRMRGHDYCTTYTKRMIQVRNSILPGILGLQDGAFCELLDCYGVGATVK